LVRVFGTMIQAAADPKKAIAVLRVAEQQLSPMHPCEPCSMGYLTSAATASARAGELDRARSFLADAERIAGMWQGGLWSGAVWEARGNLREAEGDDDRARAMFREAAEEFARGGHRSDAARCLEAAAGLRDESAPPGAGHG
jgi:ATP/maltotriose-dependent transcriptional regulator MalT